MFFYERGYSYLSFVTIPINIFYNSINIKFAASKLTLFVLIITLFLLDAYEMPIFESYYNFSTFIATCLPLIVISLFWSISQNV